MGVCYIVGAGECTESIEKREGDLVIAADGGIRHLARMGLAPDLFVGDFDSTDASGDAPIVLRHPCEKDDTDTALALALGEARGYREFYIYGGLGGERFDHSLANVQLLLGAAKRGVCVTLVRGNWRTRVLREGEKLTFSADARGYISVFAIGGPACGVTLSGLKYELAGTTLTPDAPLGVSNEFCARAASVFAAEGHLLLIYEDKGTGEEP